MAQNLRSGKIVGRRILGVLMVLLVISAFVKVSFLPSHVDVDGKRTDNAVLILQTSMNEEQALAQRIVSEEKEPSMPTRVLEKISVSKIIFFFKKKIKIFFCLVAEKTKEFFFFQIW